MPLTRLGLASLIGGLAVGAHSRFFPSVYDGHWLGSVLALAVLLSFSIGAYTGTRAGRCLPLGPVLGPLLRYGPAVLLGCFGAGLLAAGGLGPHFEFPRGAAFGREELAWTPVCGAIGAILGLVLAGLPAVLGYVLGLGLGGLLRRFLGPSP